MKYWKVTSWVEIDKKVTIEELTVIADGHSSAADHATMAYSRILTNADVKNLQEHQHRVRAFMDGIRKVELLLDDSTLGQIRREFSWWGIKEKVADGPESQK